MSKIKNIATGISEYKKTIIVVGQDMDLLVLLKQSSERD